MSNKIIITLLLTAATIITGFKQVNTDLNGNWSRKTEKCTVSAGLSMNSIPTSYTIKQNETQVEITRTQKYGSGEINTYTEVLKLDGTEVKTSRPDNKFRKASIQWSSDRTALVETSTLSDADGNQSQTSTETFTIDNNSLQIIAKITLDEQDYEWSGTFDKK